MHLLVNNSVRSWMEKARGHTFWWASKTTHSQAMMAGLVVIQAGKRQENVETEQGRQRAKKMQAMGCWSYKEKFSNELRDDTFLNGHEGERAGGAFQMYVVDCSSSYNVERIRLELGATASIYTRIERSVRRV